MPLIKLGYGRSGLEFEFDGSRFDVLGRDPGLSPLNDAGIGEQLEQPVGSPILEDIIQPGETVLFVVPDATRKAGAGQIVNLLVRRLIAAGVPPYDTACIFATGIHRRVTEAEIKDILSPFIAQRLKILHHDARNLADLVDLGATRHGIPVGLNRALLDHDHVITIGSVNYHYFAGFTGGRKLICPGLASSRTVSATHRLAFDFDSKRRADGVGIGQLQGNPVHEEFVEVVEKRPPSFSINSIVNGLGEVTALFTGDWKAAHDAACGFYSQTYSQAIAEKRPLVVVSCGGYPYDLNLIQAHKALEMASYACTDGGTIIWLAECADGLGRPDFLKWFGAGTSDGIAEMLCENYQVNGQTAWSLMKKAERFNIRVVTALSKDETRQMQLQKARDIAEALSGTDPDGKGYILPFGSAFRISTNPA
jgi:nickel-dependent lactate racemase